MALGTAITVTPVGLKMRRAVRELQVSLADLAAGHIHDGVDSRLVAGATFGAAGAMAPIGVAGANSAGVAASSARIDHVHNFNPVLDDAFIQWGTGSDVGLGLSTANTNVGTGDEDFVLALSDVDHSLHITDYAARATDWNLASATHPTIYLHSNTTPVTDYLSIGGHTGTTATINMQGGTTVNHQIGGVTEMALTATGLAVTNDIGADTLTIAAAATVGGTLEVTGVLTTITHIICGGDLTVAGSLAFGTIDMNGNELIMDANGNSSLTMDTDDQLDIRLGGADEYQFFVAGLDMNANYLDNVGYIILNAATAPAGTEVYIVNDNTGDLTLNALTGKLIELAIAGANEVSISGAAIYPATDDGQTLGIQNTNEWSDLFLASGGVIGWDNNNVTITHTAGYITVAAGDFFVANGVGAVIGAEAFETVSTGDGATDMVPEFQVQGTTQADGSMLLAVFNTTDSIAPTLAFAKGGNAAIGSHTIVADNEIVGKITAYGDDGVDIETPVAEIRFVVDEGAAAADTLGGSIEFWTTAEGGTTLTVAMTIDSDQNLMISNNNGIVIGANAQITANGVPELQVLGTTAGVDSGILIGQFSADANPSILQFVKSRNATIGSNTIVADNDYIGTIEFFPDDGVDHATKAAMIIAEVDDASPAAGDIGMAFVFCSMPGGGGAIQETMRLGANGALTFAVSADSAAVADQVSIGRYEIGAGNTVLSFSQETTVAAEVDETKFSHKMQVRLNGATYYIMLCQT